jgi:hypothetical protein
MSKNLYILATTILLMSSTEICGQHTKRQTSATASLSAPRSSTLDQSYQEIKARAKVTADAFMRRDFNTVADYTYHRVVKLMGGRANTVFEVEQEMKKIERKGYALISLSHGEPHKVQIIGKQVFSILPTTLRMKTPIGTLVYESFMIAISEDGSKTWTFVDGALAGDRQMLRQIFPFAASKLLLPPKKQPVIHPSQRG